MARACRRKRPCDVLFTPGGRRSRTDVSGVRARTRKELRRQRRPLPPHQAPARCYDHLIAAALWPKYGVNLGTLLRTCDAVSACLAVPRRPWIGKALARGNTLRRRACVHMVNDPLDWLEFQRRSGAEIVGAELADEAVRLADLPMARRPTIAVLGHEHDGIPDEALDHLDTVVEIPMIGIGASLNVAVAGSLVLYKLAGFA